MWSDVESDNTQGTFNLICKGRGNIGLLFIADRVLGDNVLVSRRIHRYIINLVINCL